MSSMLQLFIVAMVFVPVIFYTLKVCLSLIYMSMTVGVISKNDNDEVDGMYVQKDGEVRVDG